MAEQQSEERAERAVIQAAAEEKQDHEAPRQKRSFTCYSVELLKRLEE